MGEIMSSEVISFLRETVEYVYSGKWFEPNSATLPFIGIETDQVGILISYDKKLIHYYAHVLAGLPADEDMYRMIADLNIKAQLGSFYLCREGDREEDNWSLIFTVRLFQQWIEPYSTISGQMLIDILDAIPKMVDTRIAYLRERMRLDPPIRRGGTGEGWWRDLCLYT